MRCCIKVITNPIWPKANKSRCSCMYIEHYYCYGVLIITITSAQSNTSLRSAVCGHMPGNASADHPGYNPVAGPVDLLLTCDGCKMPFTAGVRLVKSDMQGSRKAGEPFAVVV